MWTFHEQSNTTGYVSDVKQALLTITKEEAEIAMQGVKVPQTLTASMDQVYHNTNISRIIIIEIAEFPHQTYHCPHENIGAPFSTAHKPYVNRNVFLKLPPTFDEKYYFSLTLDRPPSVFFFVT